MSRDQASSSEEGARASSAAQNPIVSWVRDLFGSPEMQLMTERQTGQVSVNAVSTPTSVHSAVDADVKARLRQYESRLVELHRLASKQAADILELRCAAEGLQKRQSSKLASASRSLKNPTTSRLRAETSEDESSQPEKPSVDLLASIEAVRSVAAHPTQSANRQIEEEVVQRLLSEAIGQHKSAIAESHGEMLDVLRVLCDQQAAYAERQAVQWRETLREASEVHARETEELRAQLRELREQQQTGELRDTQRETERREREELRSQLAELKEQLRLSESHKQIQAENAKEKVGDSEVKRRCAELTFAAPRMGTSSTVNGTRSMGSATLSLPAASGERVHRSTISSASELAGAAMLALQEIRGELAGLRQHTERALEEGGRDVAEALRASVDAAYSDKQRQLMERLQRDAERQELQKQINELLDFQASFQSERRALLRARREAMNKLQEAQGAIRVLCRCRPLSATERAASEPSAVQMLAHNTIGLTQGFAERTAVNAFGPNGAKEAPQVPPEFTFDCVLGSDATQDELFEEISPAISSVLRGQFVCVMAYGQTGAGKTFTMYGDGSGGLVRRAAAALLAEAEMAAAEYAERGTPVQFELGVSLLEIYNDRLRDLLAQDSLNEAASLGGTSASIYADSVRQNGNLDVRVAADGSVSVPGLVVASFSDAGAMSRLIEAGTARRITHGTGCNAASSRSHLVLTVHSVMRDKKSGIEVRGRCHLVDLAGSERINQSGVVGDRLRESQHINKSLSALEQVFVALQARAKDASMHIPYRNSKLTTLLSDALGAKGSCAKTLMIMQVSPAASSAAESLRTLRFGERCQSINLGVIRRTGRRATSVTEASTEERIRNLQLELSDARRQCKEAEARATAAESRAAMACGERSMPAVPVSPLAAALTGQSCVPTLSRTLTAARRRQLGLPVLGSGNVDEIENRAPNQPMPHLPFTLRTSKSARLPTRESVSSRIGGGLQSENESRARVQTAPPLDRSTASKDNTFLRRATSARQRALMYDARRCR